MPQKHLQLKRGTHKLLYYLEIYFCDATTDFIMYNNEYIAKAGPKSIIKRDSRNAGSIQSMVKFLELKQIMKYIGFPTSSWGEVLW